MQRGARGVLGPARDRLVTWGCRSLGFLKGGQRVTGGGRGGGEEKGHEVMLEVGLTVD